jgi:hypothetical protein
MSVGGSLQYLAAWDVHRAKVFGRCEAHTGIEPFDRLMAQVMATEPYASARCVYWIVDTALCTGPGLHCPPRGSLHQAWAQAVLLAPLPGALIVAEPVRDLLLRDPAQGAHPQDFVEWTGSSRACLPSSGATRPAATPFESKFTKQDLAPWTTQVAVGASSSPASWVSARGCSAPRQGVPTRLGLIA